MKIVAAYIILCLCGFALGIANTSTVCNQTDRLLTITYRAISTQYTSFHLPANVEEAKAAVIVLFGGVGALLLLVAGFLRLRASYKLWYAIADTDATLYRRRHLEQREAELVRPTSSMWSICSQIQPTEQP